MEFYVIAQNIEDIVNVYCKCPTLTVVWPKL